MFKIGILTYHYSVNYGAVLQAYGLYQFLTEQEYEVEFIDYRPPEARNSNWKYLYFRGQRLINPFLLVSGTQKIRKLNQFWRSQIKMSDKTYYIRQDLAAAAIDYDAVITGSDEVWNIDNSMLEYGEDRSFFLDFVDSDQVSKISYATSFGGTLELGKYKDTISKLLQDFQTILVRDNNTARLVQKCGRDSAKVLDPTFLADFSKISIMPTVKKPYIALYGSFSVAQGHCIKALAKQKNLEIISIGARPGKWQPPNQVIGIGPEEWLGYIANASFVFTNYFHGTIFSVIFRKPFISFDRPEKSIKVRDLLQDLNLLHHIVTKDQLENLNFADYWQLELDTNILSQKISRSKELLLQAIAQAQSSTLVSSSS